MSSSSAYKRWHKPKINHFTESGNLKKGETHQGYYKKEYLKHPEKYIGDANLIIYRSGWEFAFIKWCDSSPSVLKWSSEPTSVQYADRVSKLEECKKYGLNPNDPKNWIIKNYHVDFWLEIKKPDETIEKWIIEIKPSSKLKKPIPPSENASLKEHKRFNNEAKDFILNESKWKAMNVLAQKINAKFYIFTEQTLTKLGVLGGRFDYPSM